jgi:hypothetical protein
MFERFTDRARRVVVLAQEEARLLNHNYIGTEHLLLGLLAERESVAARVLHSLDVDLADARAQVREIIGDGVTAPSGHIPFTPRAKKVLELALREALQLDHNYIGTEHILLGLVREGQGVAARVLGNLGADLGRVRHVVIEVLSDLGREPTTVPAGGNSPLVLEPVAAPLGGRLSSQPRCALCGRTEERVTHLLVAGGTMLCDDCVRDAAAQLDALPEDAPARVRFRRRDVGIIDKEAATRAIERAFEAVIGPLRVAPEAALWAVEGGADTEPLLRQLHEDSQHAPVVVNDVTVERVRFLDQSEAEVSLGIWLAGNPQPLPQPAHAVLEDGTWKVSRATIEQSAALARQFRRPPI